MPTQFRLPGHPGTTKKGTKKMERIIAWVEEDVKEILKNECFYRKQTQGQLLTDLLLEENKKRKKNENK